MRRAIPRICGALAGWTAPARALLYRVDMKQRFGFGLLALLGLGACGGGGELGELASEMEGIYQVSAYTRNEAACAPGGESVLGQDGFVFVVRQELFGQDFVSAMSCSSITDCRDKHARLEAGELFGVDFSFAVSQVGVNGTLIGQGASSGFSEGELCVEGELTTTTFALDGDTLLVEQTITLANDYPADGGFCTTAGAQAAAEGNACSQMETLTATFVEPL